MIWFVIQIISSSLWSSQALPQGIYLPSHMKWILVIIYDSFLEFPLFIHTYYDISFRVFGFCRQASHLFILTIFHLLYNTICLLYALPSIFHQIALTKKIKVSQSEDPSLQIQYKLALLTISKQIDKCYKINLFSLPLLLFFILQLFQSNFQTIAQEIYSLPYDNGLISKKLFDILLLL